MPRSVDIKPRHEQMSVCHSCACIGAEGSLHQEESVVISDLSRSTLQLRRAPAFPGRRPTKLAVEGRRASDRSWRRQQPNRPIRYAGRTKRTSETFANCFLPQQRTSLIERESCLLVLNLVSSTLPCIRRPRPRLRVLDVCGFV